MDPINEETWCNVYNHHSDTNTRFPQMTLREVRRLAQASADMGHTAFYRAFEIVPVATGERFLIAFSVVNGKVTEHNDSTIPAIHW